MNTNTIPMPEVISRLARKVNCGDQAATDFLKEFSAVITQGLAADGIVRVDGLGTFKVVSEVDGKPTVEFAPQVSLAEFVNEPFLMFESVELADSLTEEELQSTTPEVEETDFATSVEGMPEIEQVDDSEGIYSDESKFEAEQAILPPPLPERFKQQTIKSKQEVAIEDNQVEIEESETINKRLEENLPRQSYDTPVPVILEPESRVTIRRVGHSTLTLVVTAVAASLLGLVLGYFAYKYVNFGMPGNVEILENGILIRHSGNLSVDSVSDSTVIIDRSDSDEFAQDETSLEQADKNSILSASNQVDPELIEDVVVVEKIVTDTVRPGNYLSVMARRHYGNAKFWIYIYLENKDKIKNPDSLENGMVLVIPPREKYGIDPSDSESLKKAEREVYRATSE